MLKTNHRTVNNMGSVVPGEMTDPKSYSSGGVSGDLRFGHQFSLVKTRVFGYGIGFSKREPRKLVGFVALGRDSRIRWIKGNVGVCYL